VGSEAVALEGGTTWPREAPAEASPAGADLVATEVAEQERRQLRRRQIGAAAAALLLVLALGLRIARIQSSPYHPSGDAAGFVSLGAQIAAHGDYAASDRGVAGSIGPTAYLPPALPYLLGVGDLLEDHAPTSPTGLHDARLEQAIVGTALVALVGLLALELGGPLVGLAALGIAAVYPPLITMSSVIEPQNLMCAFELGAVWALLRAKRSRDAVPWLIATGVLAGLAALSHESALLLAIPLVLVARGSRPVVGRRQVAGPGVVLVAIALTLAPWLIRDGVELHRFVLISNRAGIALAGTYNPSSAADGHRWLPFTSVPSLHGLSHQAPTFSEGKLDQHLLGRAVSYIGDHPLAPFQTAARNLVRLLNLTGRRGNGADVGGFWLVAVLAALGLLTPRARRFPRWLWSVPLVMMLAVVLVNAPTPRAREAIDPFLIVLAACTVVTALMPLAGELQRRRLNRQFVKRA
jgi:4-amino-4-deoxy-L-arabinose transferase-like glycosyltransferase